MFTEEAAVEINSFANAVKNIVNTGLTRNIHPIVISGILGGLCTELHLGVIANGAKREENTEQAGGSGSEQAGKTNEGTRLVMP